MKLQWIVYKNDAKWFDLDAVFETLRKLGFTPSKFVYYCALRGCDHVNKQALTPRLKDAQVLEDFLGLCKATADEPSWNDAYQMHRLVCTVNPTLLDKKLFAKHCGASDAPAALRLVKNVKSVKDLDMIQLFAASGSAALKSILPDSVIQRLLSLHAMWNPRWDTYGSI